MTKEAVATTSRLECLKYLMTNFQRCIYNLRLVTNDGLPGHFIIVEIRLFAEFNGPTNYVVVGRWQ